MCSVRDFRSRRWTWTNYWPHLTTYETQWQRLRSHEYRMCLRILCRASASSA